MGLYTNKGLVKHAEKTAALKTKYMWGGILRPITSSYIQTLKSIYGVGTGTGYSAARYAELQKYADKGYYGCDCIGLIKSYYWSGQADGGTNSPNYGRAGYPDVNATYMFNIAKKKGKISTIPEVPGLIVYSKSHPHVGVYIGNGYTIESTLGSRGDGVVKRKLDNFWEYWFECPYIDYIYDDAKTIETKVDNKIWNCEVAYNAVIRNKPTKNSTQLGKYLPGAKIQVMLGTETKDSVSGYTYIKVVGDSEKWVVKTTLK